VTLCLLCLHSLSSSAAAIVFSALVGRTKQLQTRKHDRFYSVCFSSELDTTVQCDMHVDRVKLTNDIFYSCFSQVGMIFIVNTVYTEAGCTNFADA
jgi:hypothetical protein